MNDKPGWPQLGRFWNAWEGRSGFGILLPRPRSAPAILTDIFLPDSYGLPRSYPLNALIHVDRAAAAPSNATRHPNKENPMQIIHPPNLGTGVPLPAVAPTDSIPRGTLPQPGCEIGVAVLDADGMYFELRAVVGATYEESGQVYCYQIGGAGLWDHLPKWDHDAPPGERMGWF